MLLSRIGKLNINMVFNSQTSKKLFTDLEVCDYIKVHLWLIWKHLLYKPISFLYRAHSFLLYRAYKWPPQNTPATWTLSLMTQLCSHTIKRSSNQSVGNVRELDGPSPLWGHFIFMHVFLYWKVPGWNKLCNVSLSTKWHWKISAFEVSHPSAEHHSFLWVEDLRCVWFSPGDLEKAPSLIVNNI